MGSKPKRVAIVEITGTRMIITASDSSSMPSTSITPSKVMKTTMPPPEIRADEAHHAVVEIEIGEQPAQRAGDADDADTIAEVTAARTKIPGRSRQRMIR